MSSSTLTLTVTGMTCGGCENAVKRTLMKIDGVESASASHVDQQVIATYDTTRVEPGAITRAIESLGYGVKERRGYEP